MSLGECSACAVYAVWRVYEVMPGCRALGASAYQIARQSAARLLRTVELRVTARKR